MAKRKKSSKRPKKQDKAAKKSNSQFWRQAYAFVMILVAFFLLLGGLNVGGVLPVNLFEGMSWLFGFAAYFSPVVLVYLAIVKFRDEEHLIPFGKILGGVMILISMSAIFHVFVAPDQSSRLAGEATYGGQTGHLVNSAILSVLSTGTAFVLYLLLMLVSFLFTFSIAPKNFFLFIVNLLKRKDRDTDLSELKKHTGERIDVRENVPVEHHKGELEPSNARLSSFKNAAQKLAPAEDHTALTVQSDPNWQFPGVELLNQKQDKADAGDVQGNADIIRETLRNFKIDVEMEGANVGPRVTQFTLRPPNGVKLQKITALDSNIALDLAARSIRIEAPIPGKKAVGIEVPNVRAATVRISSILTSNEWQKANSPLAFTVGKDIAGSAITGSLEKMPHLLIAGQTGSGKSVMINSLLTSLLYRNSPSDMKLILVDPKQVELTPYNDIPHLLTPVITEPEKCISALKWAVAEMERRLRTFADAGKRNITEYNSEQSGDSMPYIVIVIDELADLMMVAARDVEALVVRIAQKSRAAGIHLVLATQRPSVDVITGLIKANVPARIAFTVASQIDSRTIIDMAGAEKLLGTGDMLFLTSDMPKPIRVQGALITHPETIKVTDFLRMQQAPSYDDEVVSQPVQLNGKGGVVVGHSVTDDVDDTAWEDAVRVVIEHKKASTSYLQRRLRIGYSRAARLIETMEEQGIVGPADGSRPREVLVSSIDEVLGRNEMPSSDEVYDDMPDEPESDSSNFS
jgi:S-DNA-T family DNA segregation ATPase FtsK/SpoIIIE